MLTPTSTPAAVPLARRLLPALKSTSSSRTFARSATISAWPASLLALPAAQSTPFATFALARLSGLVWIASLPTQLKSKLRLGHNCLTKGQRVYEGQIWRVNQCI